MDLVAIFTSDAFFCFALIGFFGLFTPPMEPKRVGSVKPKQNPKRRGKGKAKKAKNRKAKKSRAETKPNQYRPDPLTPNQMAHLQRYWADRDGIKGESKTNQWTPGAIPL